MVERSNKILTKELIVIYKRLNKNQKIENEKLIKKTIKIDYSK